MVSTKEHPGKVHSQTKVSKMVYRGQGCTCDIYYHIISLLHTLHNHIVI